MNRDARKWLRYLAGHLAVGSVAAAVFITALMATDAAGLAGLMLADDDTGVAFGILAFGIWVTFGSLALGAGIMGIGRRRRGGAGPRHGGLEPASAPVRPRSGWRSSR